AGGFDVLGSHLYAEELTGVHFGVSVMDAGGATTGAGINNFADADAALTAGALTPPAATAGAGFRNVPLLHFSDADPSRTAGHCPSPITWGAGRTGTVPAAASAPGQRTPNPAGGFDVLGSHLYAEELSGAHFGVSVMDVGGATAGAGINNFAVADAALTAG